MRFLMILGLVGTTLAGPALAAPAPSCPSRSEVIDALRGDIGMTDVWLILSFGSVVGLAGSAWGAPAGVAAALLDGAVSTISGLRTIGRIDQSVRDSLPEMAGRLQRTPDDVYDQVRYGEEVITGNWLMRVAGAVAGSVLGLVTPLGPGPFAGLPGSVALGAAGGVALAGLWHRLAAWPFTDDLPELCRSAAITTRV